MEWKAKTKEHVFGTIHQNLTAAAGDWEEERVPGRCSVTSPRREGYPAFLARSTGALLRKRTKLVIPNPFDKLRAGGTQ